MGSTLLSEPRRKRKRTARAYAGIRRSTGTTLLQHKNGRKPCCSFGPVFSLPCIAVIFGLAMAVIVGVRKLGKYSARDAARRGRWGTSAYPLAVLLEEQHEIDPTAALFADPVGQCLTSSSSRGEQPSERLGPFTCVADARFFVRTLGEALHFYSTVVMYVDNARPAHPPDLTPGPIHWVGVDMAAMFSGRHQEMLLEQKRVDAGENPLPDRADLVLVYAREGALSADLWMDLMHSLMKVLSEKGVIVIRDSREGSTSTTGKVQKKGIEEAPDERYWVASVWKMIAAAACDSANRFVAAVGEIDGGIIVVRHATANDTDLDVGCNDTHMRQRAGRGAGGADAAQNTAVAAVPPRQLQFERLFLWATREQDTTIEAVLAVQAKFGGADAVRRYARRRSGRLACVRTAALPASTEPLVGEEGHNGGHLRAKSPHGRDVGDGALSSTHIASEWRSSARTCLESHLKEHEQDVRAGFALAMLLKAIGGKGVDRKVARLRAKISEESGSAGVLLWRSLHAQAGFAAVTGELL